MADRLTRRAWIGASVSGVALEVITSAAGGQTPPCEDAVIEPERIVPVAEVVDVVVCGGGPAGVAAALAAARVGATVRILEAHGCVGGIWTSGMLAYVMANFPLICQALLVQSSLCRAKIIVPISISFTGGANDRFGHVHFGEQVNFVYAQPTGIHASMRSTLTVERVPRGSMYLYLKARDDDGPDPCDIEIRFNDHILFQGHNTFPSEKWQVQRFALPAQRTLVADVTWMKQVIATRYEATE